MERLQLWWGAGRGCPLRCTEGSGSRSVLFVSWSVSAPLRGCAVGVGKQPQGSCGRRGVAVSQSHRPTNTAAAVSYLLPGSPDGAVREVGSVHGLRWGPLCSSAALHGVPAGLEGLRGTLRAPSGVVREKLVLLSKW